jgi:hypothetical protein
MSKKTIERIRKESEELQKQLAELGPIMRGSVVRIGTKNKHFYFSLNKDKKTRLVYLGDKRVELARTYSENYKKLLAIVEKVTILNMEIVKKSDGQQKENL